MAKVTTTVTTKIVDSDGDEFVLSETKAVTTSDNPRFWAEVVYLAGEELTARNRAIVEARYSKTPEGMKPLMA